MVIDFFIRDKIYRPKEDIENYTVIDVIGEGKYGICYVVRKDNKKFILKQLKRNVLRKSGHKASFEEKLLSNIHHDRIPKLIQKIDNNKLTAFILEIKEGKTFEEIVFYDNYVFERLEIYDIGRQLIDILRYLHQCGIVHRDMRLPNVIYYDKKVYLVDFGLARWANHEYKCDLDFSYLGDFLLHLYYTSYDGSCVKSRPWYEELNLSNTELYFFQRLMGIKERYKDIIEIEYDFLKLSEKPEVSKCWIESSIVRM